MPKGRGKSWTRSQVLDLWGDQKIQAALSEGTRNIEIFEEVAAGMAARGHKKTAFECRAKSKSLRLKYKHTMALNKKSGHNTVTCAYYEELHRILHKDKDIYLELGILQTRRRRRGQGATQIPTSSSEDTSQELFTEGSQDTSGPQPSTSSYAGLESQSMTHPPSTDSEGSEEEMAPGGRPIGYGMPERPLDDNQEAEEPMEDSDRDPDHLPPDVNMADLTAGERTALTKARWKEPSLL
ncbi:UNVERIFIED_CONTAM: hypothetical protein K2H54_056961 [Gekko kuhli]